MVVNLKYNGLPPPPEILCISTEIQSKCIQRQKKTVIIHV